VITSRNREISIPNNIINYMYFPKGKGRRIGRPMKYGHNNLNTSLAESELTIIIIIIIIIITLSSS
jgi:hypothetical protein